MAARRKHYKKGFVFFFFSLGTPQKEKMNVFLMIKKKLKKEVLIRVIQKKRDWKFAGFVQHRAHPTLIKSDNSAHGGAQHQRAQLQYA